MAAAARWTEAETDRLRALHAAGKSLHAIAAEMGRGKGTISAKAKAAGLAWDREQVQAATQAKVADARERRATLQLRLLDDAERLREQLWQPAKWGNFGGRENTYNEVILDQPLFADKLKLMQAVGIAVDRSLKLADHDSVTRDMPAVDQWLAHMTGGTPDGG